MALVVTAAASVQAAPIVFTTTNFDTTAYAFSGNLADNDSNSSSSSPLPVVSTATVAGATDLASAIARGTSGMLSASTEAESFPGSAGASTGSQSHFVGTFLGSGALILISTSTTSRRS